MRKMTNDTEYCFLAHVTKAFLGWLEDMLVRTEIKYCLLLFGKRKKIHSEEVLLILCTSSL